LEWGETDKIFEEERERKEKKNAKGEVEEGLWVRRGWGVWGGGWRVRGEGEEGEE
jgi:hypothetical protein